MLSGFSGSGKSYVADILKSRGWFSIGIADTLKDYVSEKYSIDRGDLDTQEGKKKMLNNESYRDILIREAKNLKKDDKNYFIKQVVERVQNQSRVVISDMRYPNEYYYIKKKFHNVISVNIQRDIYNKIDDESEKSLVNFNFDTIIQNNENLLEQLLLLN